MRSQKTLFLGRLKMFRMAGKTRGYGIRSASRFSIWARATRQKWHLKTRFATRKGLLKQNGGKRIPGIILQAPEKDLKRFEMRSKKIFGVQAWVLALNEAQTLSFGFKRERFYRKYVE